MMAKQQCKQTSLNHMYSSVTLPDSARRSASVASAMMAKQQCKQTSLNHM
jgi:hypothetical protein